MNSAIFNDRSGTLTAKLDKREGVAVAPCDNWPIRVFDACDILQTVSNVTSVCRQMAALYK